MRTLLTILLATILTLNVSAQPTTSYQKQFVNEFQKKRDSLYSANIDTTELSDIEFKTRYDNEFIRIVNLLRDDLESIRCNELNKNIKRKKNKITPRTFNLIITDYLSEACEFHNKYLVEISNDSIVTETCHYETVKVLCNDTILKTDVDRIKYFNPNFIPYNLTEILNINKADIEFKYSPELSAWASITIYLYSKSHKEAMLDLDHTKIGISYNFNNGLAVSNVSLSN